ncbi:hypothetical protein BDQ17DRAFT_1434899 [Cyathus striatus]|nr:hypothetical protein BDQ17DRAFT_1434899 [Cyathus striatus]
MSLRLYHIKSSADIILEDNLHASELQQNGNCCHSISRSSIKCIVQNLEYFYRLNITPKSRFTMSTSSLSTAQLSSENDTAVPAFENLNPDYTGRRTRNKTTNCHKELLDAEKLDETGKLESRFKPKSSRPHRSKLKSKAPF